MLLARLSGSGLLILCKSLPRWPLKTAGAKAFRLSSEVKATAAPASAAVGATLYLKSRKKIAAAAEKNDARFVCGLCCMGLPMEEVGHKAALAARSIERHNPQR